MSKVLDEISIEYWENHCEGKGKNYFCRHGNHIYGKEMKGIGIQLIPIIDGVEGIPIFEDTCKRTYIKFVEYICNLSEDVKNNYLKIDSDKYRIFTKEEGDSFTSERKKSTRIKGTDILIHGKEYYVAVNLNICEYFNALSKTLTAEFKRIWHIRLIDDEFDDSDSEYLVYEVMKNTFDEISKKYPVKPTSQNVSGLLSSIEKDYKDEPVKEKVRVSITLSRNKSYADAVKLRANYTCEICGAIGFLKPDGTRYSEAHHIGELSKTRIDNPNVMICVCPTCHRIIHYGTQEELDKRICENKCN